MARGAGHKSTRSKSEHQMIPYSLIIWYFTKLFVFHLKNCLLPNMIRIRSFCLKIISKAILAFPALLCRPTVTTLQVGFKRLRFQRSLPSLEGWHWKLAWSSRWRQVSLICLTSFTLIWDRHHAGRDHWHDDDDNNGPSWYWVGRLWWWWWYNNNDDRNHAIAIVC